MATGEIERTLLAAASLSRGHFRYESGHHGDLWLDLDGLFRDARRLRGWATALAAQAVACRPEIPLGDAASRITAQAGVPFFALASIERRMWLREDCPLCESGVALEDHVP